MTTLRFELTMPNNGSWNGRDTGAKPDLFIFKKVPSDKARQLEGRCFYYDFNDG